MNYLLDKSVRGDEVKARRLTGRRVTLFPTDGTEEMPVRGFTLIELVITITVLSILTLGVVPLMKLSVKRQREQQLRQNLRQIRSAIDEFRRDATGMTCTNAPQQGRPVPTYIDPRRDRKSVV